MPRNWIKFLLQTPVRTRGTRRRLGFRVEALEDRSVPANFATGAAVGAAGTVGVFDTAALQQVNTLTPYGTGFTGGINVAMGDVTGDGTADIITGTSTGSSHVKVFDGKTFAEVRSFVAFDAGFTGGVNVAAGDINKDGTADIVAAAASGDPLLKVFNGKNGTLLQGYYAFDRTFTGGVRVAVGDINGDGQKDIVTASGLGADGNVRVFDGATQNLIRSFNVFTGGFAGGLFVGAGDLDGDGADEVLVGAGPGAGPHVKAFDGRTNRETASFFAFDTTFAGGVFAAVVPDTNGDGVNEIAVGAIGTQHLKTFDGAKGTELSSKFMPSGTVSGGLAQVPTNAVPVLAPIGNKTGAALSAITFTLSATDADTADTLTYSATNLPTGATLNASTGAFSWTPTVTQTGTFTTTFAVSDGKASDSETITFTISATNVAPTITSNGGGATAAVSVSENTTAVTTVTATDQNPGTTLTYSIVPVASGGGADAARFAIDPSTGALTFVAAPNFESPSDAGTNNVYDVTVRASDGSLTGTQALAVTVTNVNEAPTIISNGGGATAALTQPENGTAVTTVGATDPDAGTTLSFSIVSVANGGGADAALFNINPTTGVLTFVTAPDFEAPTDAGGNNVYDVTVQASDGALTDTQALAITITDANEAPTITSNGGGATAAVGVPENTTAVTTVTATDPDAGQTLTYSIAPGGDGVAFSINPTSGVLTFTAPPNFEAPTDSDTNNTYVVTVVATDNGTGNLTDTQAVTVTVTDVPAPTIANVMPNTGPTPGGTAITITGTALTGATAVTVGGNPAVTFTVDSATQITATTPAGAPGPVDVVVTTPEGTATAPGAFGYM